MGAALLGYLGLILLGLLPVVGPLLAGRWLADREDSLDPEIMALEAEALMLLASSEPG